MSRIDASSPFSLHGRRVLVTGASSGLGRHFARTLSDAGADLVLAARRVDRLDALASELADAGARAIAVALDVRDPISVRACFEEIQARVGGIDVLINNAGIAHSKPALEQSEQDWDDVISTNLSGAWRVAQEGARRMAAASPKGGCIVNIASILAQRVAGFVAPYCAAKAGLVHLTRALALELSRHAIRVNALAPGYIETELNRDFLHGEAGERLMARIPQRRFGKPEDLDGALLLLCSPAGAYINGSVLAVDGGHLVNTL